MQVVLPNSLPMDAIDAYPIPKVKNQDKDYGIETSNIPQKFEEFKTSQVKESILRIFCMKRKIILVQIQLLLECSAIKGISDDPAYKDNDIARNSNMQKKLLQKQREKYSYWI